MSELFQAKEEADPSLFAIVVIGRNEGQRLLDCLQSLGVHRSRTIYVDSGSSDSSPEAAARLGVHVERLDMSIPFTAGRARNEGYRAACQRWPALEFIQFIDGDCVLDPDWLETAYRFLRTNSQAALVFGRRRERWPDRSVFNALCDREWSGVPGSVSECGGDVFARTSALRDGGSYSEHLIAGEEPELCVRLRELGWLIWRLDSEMTLHDANMTSLRQWWKRTTRSGYAFAEVAQLHWRSPFGIWKRNMARAIGWGGVLPLVTIAGATFHPAALILMTLYPLQLARIAVGQQWNRKTSWRNGVFDVLGKFPEFSGTAKYFLNTALYRRQTIIEYK